MAITDVFYDSLITCMSILILMLYVSVFNNIERLCLCNRVEKIEIGHTSYPQVIQVNLP